MMEIVERFHDTLPPELRGEPPISPTEISTLEDIQDEARILAPNYEDLREQQHHSVGVQPSSPLFSAAKLITTFGKDQDVTKPKMETPVFAFPLFGRSLCQSASEGDLKAVKALLDQGADVESKDESGKTPLSLAAENGHLDVVKFLVNEADRKADVESKDFYQRTPLSWAASHGHLEVVKFLVNEADPKADVESKDNNGKTALDLARQGERWRPEECRAVAAWLETKGAGEAGA